MLSSGKMDDYVMVPREPTEEMVLNGVRAFQHAYSATDNLADWKECYRAMIAMAHTREWVGLTEEEIWQEWSSPKDSAIDFARAIEAKLKEKNT